MAKILFIEDDLSVQFTLKKLMECFGYTVIVANDGPEGLAQYKKYNPSIDIIICDIDMPYWDGFQFLQQLKMLGGETPPFVFISAYVDRNIVRKVSKLPEVDCIIKKPVDQEILKTILIAIRMKNKTPAEQ
ncbi:MAG: response regulator [Puniceicoccales bacterium]|jgi:CheY-like chemotaxis protein|nr:response regulator [Puniceicoccales bacterium]